MAKILVVDDEENICELVSYNLQKEGYEVDIANSGTEGLMKAQKGGYDLLILDIMLPGLDGIEICRQLRKDDSMFRLPIIMLSAKGDEVDRIIGLEFGADDYVTKPFSPRELVARVKAVLRRIDVKMENEDGKIIRKGPVTLNPVTREVTVDGKLQEFTPKEYALLELLMNNEGQAFSREYLLEKIWGYDFLGDTRTVDVHMRHLRQKIEKDPSNPVYLQTVRGYGYRFKV